MKQLATALRSGKRRAFDMHYEGFFAAFENYAQRGNGAPKPRLEAYKDKCVRIEKGEGRKKPRRGNSGNEIPKNKLNDLIRSLKDIEEGLGKK